MNNIGKLFADGGIVMWPLLIFSILVLAFAIERGWFWWRVVNRQNRFARNFLEAYQYRPKAAIKHIKENRGLPLARIFLAAVSLETSRPEQFRLALESEAQAEIPLFKRFTTFFDMVVTLSPLFGLLGTVLGLISSFAALKLGQAGGGNTAGVSSGISEALVSTASGLIVAIIASMFASIFRALYLRQMAFVQEYCGQLELIHLALCERQSQFSPATEIQVSNVRG